VLGAFLWGLTAASSLGIGAAIGTTRPWSDRVIGTVLAFGAGALISAVSFDLAGEGLQQGGGLPPVALGLAAGAIVFTIADAGIDRLAERRAADTRAAAGPAISLGLGAFLDGVPENLVLGIGLSLGQSISVALVLAIIISNLPEAMVSATELRKAGVGPRRIVLGWVAVALVTALAAPVGFAVADALGREYLGAVNGFAAGALLVMLVTSMTPEAHDKLGRLTGLATVLGFAFAVALSTSS
jgi:ZIP family zinc transporter